MNKDKIVIEKALNLTCPECQAVYQLLEIHHQEQNNCLANCLTNWKQLLHSHFQEQIILHLAQAEANKDQNHEK